MPKNIVVCCDGTWNRFDRGRITNVVHLSSCLVRDTGKQVVFYDPGVGTIAAERWRTRIGQALSRLVGGAFGAGIDANIAEAYGFLSEHYQEGDRIYLFGFSRGAYTVRALAAVLHHFGLLERGNSNLHPYMREMFLSKHEGKPDFELYRRFRAAFAKPTRVHFLGAWDTVASVGWITRPVMLPSTSRNPSIAHIRHAVAIDERRKSFQFNLFTRASPSQDLLEVWFPGSHADVGGGHPENESGLSKISLEWMLREAVACGLLVKEERRSRVLGADGRGDYAPPDPLALLHDPFKKALWRMAQFAPRRTFRMVDDGLRGRWDWSWQRRRRVLPVNAVIHESVVRRRQGGIGYDPFDPAGYIVEG